MSEPKTNPLQVAGDALEQIALAGMSGTGEESPEAMNAWHARRAREFIGIAARALDTVRAALAAAAPSPAPAGADPEREYAIWIKDQWVPCAMPAGGAEPVAAAVRAIERIRKAYGSLMVCCERPCDGGGGSDTQPPDGPSCCQQSDEDVSDLLNEILRALPAPTAQPQPADAEAVGTKPGYPQTSRDWLAAMVDIWEDGQKFESGEGCYVAGALGDSMREAKAHLSRTATTEPTVLFDDRPQNQRIAEAEERMRNPAPLQFEDESAQPEAPAKPSDNPERDEFYRVFNESTELTGHQPTLYDVWLMARGRMDTSHRAMAPVARAEPESFDGAMEDVYDQCCAAIKPLVDRYDYPGSVVETLQRLVDERMDAPAQQPAELLTAAKAVVDWWHVFMQTAPADPVLENAEWAEFDELRKAIKAQGGSL